MRFTGLVSPNDLPVSFATRSKRFRPTEAPVDPADDRQGGKGNVQRFHVAILSGDVGSCRNAYPVSVRPCAGLCEALTLWN